ncbi:MAG: radical SAM protein [archaeon]|nr:radical SAM protein [archaeon]
MVHEIEVKGILSTKNGMNLYRGCSHGCIYCDSRSKCYGFTHDFEDIEVKSNALELLEKALKGKRKKCMIATGSMTDPYIPLERKLGNVRKALSLAEKYGFGFSLITKSDLVLRDIDLLASINRKAKAVVQMTVTTINDDLCRILEPDVCITSRRFEALKQLHDAGIPTVVWLSPILPFINDNPSNIAGIVKCCHEAGVERIICFGMGMTLREGNREYYYSKLDEHFPGLKEKYIARYGNSYVVSSVYNNELMHFFGTLCDRFGIIHDNDEIFRYLSEMDESAKPVQRMLSDF